MNFFIKLLARPNSPFFFTGWMSGSNCCNLQYSSFSLSVK